jgi:hypothetical protein
MSTDTDHFNIENGYKDIKIEPVVYETNSINIDNYDLTNKNSTFRPNEINGNKRYSLDSNHSSTSLYNNLKQTNDLKVNGNTSSNDLPLDDRINEDEHNENDDDQKENLNNSIDASDIVIRFQNKRIDLDSDDIEDDKNDNDILSTKIINDINFTNNHNKNRVNDIKTFSSPNLSTRNSSMNCMKSVTEINNTAINSSNPCLSKEQLKNVLVSIFYVKKPYVREPMVLNKNLIFSLFAVLFSFVFYVFFVKSLQLSLTNTNAAPSIDSQNAKTYLMKRKEFEMKINLLKLKYPNQTKTFWANIESTFRHSVLNSKDPSIVMIVNEEQTRKLSERLADDIFKFYLNILDKSDDELHHLIIDPKNDNDFSKSIESNDSNRVKLILDNRLMKIFDNSNKLAMIKNIQEIPAKSMILFYTYGDILPDAKYPGVLILMKLNLDENFDDQQRTEFLKSTARLSSFVETHLRKMWSKSIHEDQLAPLFSRIGNNVILVNTE